MNPEGIEQIYELSPLQQGMLFHSVQGDNPAVLVVQFSCAVDAGLNSACFRRAWAHAVTRHAALRTSFHWEDLEKPYQVVHAHAHLPWTEIDWTERDVDELFPAFLQDDKRGGFALDQAPAMRLTLIRTRDGYRFVWTLHHIILDGWSFGIVLESVFSAYEFLAAGNEPAAEPAPGFSEYIDWLKEQPAGQAEAFWRRYLAGFENPIRIAPDPVAPSGCGYERHEVEMGAGDSAALHAFARRHRLTLNTVVQGAWAILLSRATRERDVVWGTVVSGRPVTLHSAEHIAGLFINSIPARTQIDPAEPVLEFLRRLQTGQTEARTYEFASLFDIQSWSDVPRPRQLFESLVIFESYPVDGLLNSPTSLRVSAARIDESPTHPLNLAVIPGERPRFALVFDSALYSTQTARSLLRWFATLVESITAASESSSIAGLSWMSEEEISTEVEAFNRTATGYPREAVVHKLFEDCARRYPQAIAVTDGASRVSYSELDAKANSIAFRLANLGVKTSDYVAVRMPPSVDFIAVLLGILKCGAAYLPVDSAYPAERVEFMLVDSGAALFIDSDSFAGQAHFAGARLTVDGLRPESTNAAQFESREVVPDSPIYLMYTSGSTGTPKGAVVPHRAVVRLVRDTNYVRLGTGERIAQASNISFDAATFEIWGALLNGGTLVLLRPKLMLEPAAFGADLERLDITTMFITTALFNQFAQQAPWTFRSLRCLLFGGEAVDPRAVEAVLSAGPPVHLVHVYGPTESTTFATWHEVVESDVGVATIPIGKPVSNTTVFICGPDLEPLPNGVTGEICIGGDGLALAYHARPELSADRFVHAPALQQARVYRTGDLGRRRPDGAIVFVGRLDNQIKLRGFRIETGEIEAALRSHAGVAEAVILLNQDSTSGEKRLVAYFSGAAEVASLKEHLRRRLPEFMLPAAFVKMNALPVNANGKIDRQALPAPPAGPGAAELEIVAPASVGTLRNIQEAIRLIWQEALGITSPGVDENFFDLGGHSILIMRVFGHLKNTEILKDRKLAIVDLFNYPTIRSLATYLAQQDDAQPEQVTQTAPGRVPGREPIAIIGMAGRFPGAADVDQLWRNLAAGVESIRVLTPEEMLAAGVEPAMLDDPRYVSAAAPLDDADLFDAEFFGLNAREAEITDPQHRIFLECAEACLEHGGYDSLRYQGRIGIFAGAAMSTYLLNHLSANEDVLRGLASLQVLIGNDKDFLPTRVAYKLNLRGPAVNVQTACSTSLVSVHMACQSLREGACEMALAGGVSVLFPQKTGYAYQEDSILSPDGHCRAFDANARGTIAGSGSAVVLLKPLSRALEDGDTIHALILGSAVNNDGSVKAGFTAPSVEGQAAVISSAVADASVDASSISYVEAHGTGTQLGDPIEIRALNKALGGHPGDEPCYVGSLKTNVGHLDAAAGVASLIKVALQMKHRQIAPSLHFESPNPELPLNESRLAVNAQLRPWATSGPLRAGVSSFGIGGTNVHVVVEEAPARESSPDSKRDEILVLSARSETSLARMQERLATALECGNSNLGDIAWTLQTGRRAWQIRQALVTRNVQSAISALRSGEDIIAGDGVSARNGVAFLFPGQASQYRGMGAALYESSPVFRAQFDRCLRAFSPYTDADLRSVCFENTGGLLDETQYTQPLLFAIEFALAQLWISYGVSPVAMLGHSIGEYVAACLAGVFSLDDTAGIVAARGRLMQSAPAGQMLSVRLTENELLPRLPESAWIAAVNGPALCTISGTAAAITALETQLRAEGVAATRLATSHAFHCPLMDSVLEPFRQVLSRVKFAAPVVPFLSNVTGAFLSADAAQSPDYWVEHLRRPVLFHAGLEALARRGVLLLECGPGSQMAAMAKLTGHSVVCSLDRSALRGDEDGAMARAVARLWTAGVEIDWSATHSSSRRRAPLPTYAFDRQRYFVEPSRRTRSTETRAVEDSLWRPTWMRLDAVPVPAQPQPWCVVEIAAQSAGGSDIARALNARHKLYSATAAQNPAAFDALARAIAPGTRVLFVASESSSATFYALLFLCRSLAEAAPTGSEVAITVVTRGACSVAGQEVILPELALLSGACCVIPQEFPGFSCRHIDIDLPLEDAVPRIVAEVAGSEAVVALRGRRRWIPNFSRVPVLPNAPGQSKLRDNGVYLITGGYSGIGLALAEHLAATRRARLILVGRHGYDPASQSALRIETLKKSGVEVLCLKADVSKPADVRQMLSNIDSRFDQIDGVIHSAGVAGGGVIALKTIEAAEAVFAPKVSGTRNLCEALRNRKLGFFAICSSLSSVVGGYGQVDYSAANAFADAVALSEPLGVETPVISIGWDTWGETGMAVDTALPSDLASARRETLRAGLSTREALRAFDLALSGAPGHVLVSKQDLNERIRESRRAVIPALKPHTAPSLHARPSLPSQYVPPRQDLDRALASVWSELLGVEPGIHDDFFDLGGHSLMATQAIARIRDLFQVDISLRSFLEQTTIDKLGKLLVAREPNPGQTLTIASMIVSVQNMSTEEVESGLQANIGSTAQ